LILGGSLTGLDSNGNGAIYNFAVGYGDETGTPTYLAEATLTFADIANPTLAGLLTAIDSSLEAQLPTAFQGDLTLDLADNALNFTFPASIQDPTVEGYFTNVGLFYSSGLEIVPEPSSAALLGAGIGILGLAALRNRKRQAATA